jgi:hypothetical protein
MNKSSDRSNVSISITCRALAPLGGAGGSNVVSGRCSVTERGERQAWSTTG